MKQEVNRVVKVRAKNEPISLNCVKCSFSTWGQRKFSDLADLSGYDFFSMVKFDNILR